MIDVHTHILPCIDDGAQSIDNFLSMANAAVNDGITTMVATPHHKNENYNNPSSSIEQLTYQMNCLLEKEKIHLELVPGQEVRMHGDLLEGLHIGEILPINNKSYVLVEFPSDHIPKYSDEVFFNMQLEGYKPIIAHPERNREIIQNPEKLYDFVERGIITQITASSLIGLFGKKIMKFSYKLIKENLTHIIASDAHNVNQRGFCLNKAYQEIENKFGEGLANMYYSNSFSVLKGLPIELVQPKYNKKNTIRKLFNIY
ncbi:tyrosine-protein phosphatase [Pontibacillus salicampi]|uniref:Tyrosine-protein phosphatase n=1 Tax=Pontibacillus salicampi TaxID=1449801 RepID=A0ABV6LSC1_9BACI